MKHKLVSTVLPLRLDLPPLTTVVIKIGSRIVAEGTVVACQSRMRTLVEDVVALRNSGIRVVVVCSGAIAHGMKALGLEKRPKNIPDKQACAAIGQYRLMESFQTLFAPQKIAVGQVLLTWDDLRDKQRYLNLRNTLYTLLDYGVVPIINENDSVGVEEIRFGNNDLLGAQIALLAQADLYVMLTDVNGLYSDNPTSNKGAIHFPVVEKLDAHVVAMAKAKGSELSVGGMATKLSAADLVCKAGMPALIGNGFSTRLSAMMKDTLLSTLFLPRTVKMNSRDRWIAFAGKPRGILHIDGGATKALVEKGKSLLPAGILSVTGTFGVGDMVSMVDPDNVVRGSGLVNYTADDIRRIKGMSTLAVKTILGNIRSSDEVVHRDNLVVLG